MPSLIHIIETSLLVLVTYLLACATGYGVHRILYAARGTRQVQPGLAAVAADSVPRPKRVMTPAARLAASVSDDPSPPLPLSGREPAGRAPHRQSVQNPDAPRPAAMSRPRAEGPDNLKRIKGIGPKIEAALNELGVYHLDQIAQWSRSNVDWVDKQLVLRGRIIRERWIEQAAELAPATRLSA